MLITKVDLEGFAGATMSVEFPRTGLTLITGPNGSGKSRLLEAITWACWQQSIRGQRPDTKPPCTASVSARIGGQRVMVHRQRLTRRELVLSANVGGEDLRHRQEPPTHVQERLDRVLPPYGVWVRASVIGSTDTAGLATVQFAERIRTIETLLHTAAWDKAQKEANEQRALKDREISRVHGELETVQRLSNQVERTKSKPPNEDLIRRLANHANKTRDLAHKLSAVSTEYSKQQASFHRDISDAEWQLDGFKNEICPLCNRPLTDAEKLAELREKARSTLDEITPKLRELETALATQQEEHASLTRQYGEVKRQLDKLLSDKRACEAHAAAVRNLQDATSSVSTLKETASTLGLEAAAWKLAAEALGPRGARTIQLAEIIASVEDTATSWLGWLTRADDPFEMWLELQRDRIMVGLRRDGGTLDYRAASGGQRRRLDTALALALADTASAAGGLERGSLFIDEMLDGLDRDGIEAAAELIRVLASDLSVTVITHRELLVDLLRDRADQHIEMG